MQINQSQIIFSVAIMAFIFNPGKNIIVFVIGLEQLLLATAILSLTLSYQFDDLLGANLTQLIQPIAGAESAVCLAYLVAYTPIRGTIIVR